MRPSLPTTTPERISRGLVVVSLAVAVALVCVYLPRAVRDLGDLASNNAQLSYSDREVAAGNAIVVDQEAAYQARANIPPDATYRVATGSPVRGATDLTTPFVGAWFRSFLMPRRPAADAHWIVCYGCDVSRLGGTYVPVWHDDAGISLGRLR